MSAREGNTAPEWVPTGSVSVRVPGKVNLYLEVGDRRDDGYHEVNTVFHAVSLLDEVTVSTADTLTLEVCGEGAASVPVDDRNLAWRAAELLAEHVGRAPDVAISIEKTIPVAGGMAGGSADAAAVLVAMNSLWELGVPRRDLHSLGAQIGSDVPFALHGGTALGTGRGEELATVLARNTFHWVLAFWAQGGLSTPEGIRRDRPFAGRAVTVICRPGSTSAEPVLAALASRATPAQLAPLLGNELQPAALIHRSRSLRRTLRAGRRGRCAGRHRVGFGADVRVPVLIGHRLRSTWAPNWPGPVCAGPFGSPAGRCRVRAWCRVGPPRHSFWALP